MISEPCCVCGVDATSHPDDAHGGLAHCGDCGRPTWGEHRDESQAQRCPACEARQAETEAPDFPSLLAAVRHVRAIVRNGDFLFTIGELESLNQVVTGALLYRGALERLAKLEAALAAADAELGGSEL